MNSKISIHQLAEGVGAEAHVTAITAQLIIKELFDLASSTLEAGEEFEIEGIGRFRHTDTANNPVAFQPAEEFAKEVNAPFDMFEPQPLSAPLDELEAIDRRGIEGLPTEATGVGKVDIASDMVTFPSQSPENVTVSDEGIESRPSDSLIFRPSSEASEETIIEESVVDVPIPDEPSIEAVSEEIAHLPEKFEDVTEDKDKVDHQEADESIVNVPDVKESAGGKEGLEEGKKRSEKVEDFSAPEITAPVPPAFNEPSVKTEGQQPVQPPIFNPLPPFPEEVEEKVLKTCASVEAPASDLPNPNSGADNPQREGESSNQGVGPARSSSRFGIGFATGLIVGLAVGALAMFVLFLAMTRLESRPVSSTEETEETEETVQTVEKPTVGDQPSVTPRPEGTDQSEGAEGSNPA